MSSGRNLEIIVDAFGIGYPPRTATAQRGGLSRCELPPIYSTFADAEEAALRGIAKRQGEERHATMVPNSAPPLIFFLTRSVPGVGRHNFHRRLIAQDVFDAFNAMEYFI